MHQIKNRWTES